jgi:hypothetical protein
MIITMTYYQTSIITPLAFFVLFFSYIGLNVALMGDPYDQSTTFSLHVYIILEGNCNIDLLSLHWQPAALHERGHC